MEQPFIFLIVILAVLIVGYKIHGYYEYFTIPNLKSYLKSHPNCKTNNGIKCCDCGSNSIRNWGLSNSDSFFRIHICNHCGMAVQKLTNFIN